MDSGLITTQAISPDQLLNLLKSGAGVLGDSAKAIIPDSIQNTFDTILTNIQQIGDGNQTLDQSPETDDAQTIEAIIANLTSGIVAPPPEALIEGNEQIAVDIFQMPLDTGELTLDQQLEADPAQKIETTIASLTAGIVAPSTEALLVGNEQGTIEINQHAQGKATTTPLGIFAESSVALEGGHPLSEIGEGQKLIEPSIVKVHEASIIDPEVLTGREDKTGDLKEIFQDNQIKLSLKDQQLLANIASQITRKPQTAIQQKPSVNHNIVAGKFTSKAPNLSGMENPANAFHERQHGAATHKPLSGFQADFPQAVDPAPEKTEKPQVTTQNDATQVATDSSVSVKTVEDNTIGLKHFEQALGKAVASQSAVRMAGHAIPNPAQTVNPAELLAGVKMTLKQGGSQLLMQLRPDVLGRALVTMRHLEGKLSLEFMVENESARICIQSEANHLKETLVSAGFAEVIIDVKTMPPTMFQTDVESGESQLHQEQSPGGDRNERQAQEEQERLARKPLMLGYNTFELIA